MYIHVLYVYSTHIRQLDLEENVGLSYKHGHFVDQTHIELRHAGVKPR